MNISRVLYETFKNFVCIVVKHDCHNYIDKIWNEFANG